MQTNRVTFPKFHAKQRQLYRAMYGNGALTNQGLRHVWRCGRRLGKTTALETISANSAVKGKAVGWFSPNYKLLLPSYKRILRMLRPLVLHSSKVDGIIELKTGGTIEFWTLNDEDAGRSRAYDLVIIDEAGLVLKGLRDIFERSIAPTLLDRRGDAIMAGTPKGISADSFFYLACTDKDLGWTESHMPTRDNPTLDPVGIANLPNEYPPLVYQQEFLAEFIDWRGSAFFCIDSFLVDGEAIPMPTRCDYVYAVIDTAVKTGKKNDGTAVSFYALLPVGAAKHRLVVLDWDIIQIEGALLETWLPTIFQRLEGLAGQCGARMGSAGAWIEDKATGMVLLQQARNRGWNAHAIDSKLTSVGKDERSISVSGYVYQGLVKICAPAYDKVSTYKEQTRNHWIGQVCGYRIGVEDQDDDLEDTMTYGVALGLGDYRGF